MPDDQYPQPPAPCYSPSPSADAFAAWFASHTPEEQEQIRTEIHIFLWNGEIQFADFPQDPTPGDAHTDGDGQSWTWMNQYHGWHRERDWRKRADRTEDSGD